MIDPSGNFYGTTEGGGLYNNGTIFKFSYKGGKMQGRYLFNFPNCMQGCYPMGTLARDSAGNLYGMAQGGTNSCGGLSCGVTYRLAPQTNGTWKYSVLVNLSETTGGVLPFYGLTLTAKDTSSASRVASEHTAAAPPSKSASSVRESAASLTCLSPAFLASSLTVS